MNLRPDLRMGLRAAVAAAAAAAECEAPEITSQSEGGEYDGETPVTLMVEATGSAPLAYQWYAGLDGVQVAEVDGNFTTETEIEFVDASNIEPGDLLIRDTLFLTKEALLVTIVEGFTVTVERGALGTAIDDIVSGTEFLIYHEIADAATSATYEAAPAEETDYVCVVSNACGFALSEDELVTVAPWHPTDYFTEICFPLIEAAGITASGGNLVTAVNQGSLALELRAGASPPAWAEGVGLTFENEYCHWWDTIDDEAATLSDFMSASGRTVIFVIKPDIADVVQVIMEARDFKFLSFLNTTGDGVFTHQHDDGATKLVTTASTTNKVVLSQRHSGGNIYIGKNGVEEAPVAAGDISGLTGIIDFGSRVTPTPALGFTGVVEGIYALKSNGNPSGLAGAITNLLTFHSV
jgi:hypothetical protein